MTRNLKTWLSAITAIFVMAAAVGVVYGFTSKSTNKKVKQAPREWYGITVAPGGDASDPADQQISTIPIVAPPATNPLGCAQDNNTGILCSVLLDVPEADYEFDSPQTMETLPSSFTLRGDAMSPNP